MPCFSKIQTKLLDVASIEAAASQLGITVKKINANNIVLTKGYDTVTLSRLNEKEQFSAQGDTSLLDEMIPAYAKKQLVKFAKSKGYTVSQGNTGGEFVLTKYE